MQVVTCKKRILVFTKLFRVCFIISVNTINSNETKKLFRNYDRPLLVLKFFIFVFVLFCGFTIVVTFFNNLISVNDAIILIK